MLEHNAMIGEQLFEKATGNLFTVLCNCMHSHPRKWTERQVNANKELYVRKIQDVPPKSL